MDWVKWRNFLEELVGLESGSEKVYLLVPKSGRNDLSEEEGEELAHVVHKRLFTSYSSARYQLERLVNQSPKESLPLLYLSAWIARQQEDAHAFWPPFRDAVIRNRLSSQTVQQSLAPLITTLWIKAHRQLALYRPQEGYVHVKWPQAHAGLTEGETQLLTSTVVKNAGAVDEPPDELYAEPNEFLALLRIWLQAESHVPKRLSRLIFGQDGPALVVAELVQKLLLKSWPPKHISIATPTTKKLPPPFIRLDLDPIRLSVALPAGSVSGYAMLQANYGGNTVQLEASYFERTQITSYKPYEWPIIGIPWPSEVALVGYESPVRMRVIPECPFNRGRLGLIMFDLTTGRCVRRWRPNHYYWLFVSSTDIPNWVSELFADIETEDAGHVGDLDVIVLSAVGRDIVRELGHDRALQVLQEMEEEVNRSGALITLPDYNELFEPEVTFCGGLPIAHGQHPTYLEAHNPLVVVKNIPERGVVLSIHKRDDTGRELLIASVSLDGKGQPNPVILELPALDSGFYVIRGLNEPKYFSVTSDLPHATSVNMHVNIQLLQSDEAISVDDVRHFEHEGIEIRGWPYARVMFKVFTEAGSNAYPVRLDSDGRRVIRAYDIDLPHATKWARIQANAWLAASELIELVLRPYVSPDDWVLGAGKLIARIRGVDAETGCVLGIIPDRPWYTAICESERTVGPDMQVDIDLPVMSSSGWIILTDSTYSGVWLFSRIGQSDIAYDIQDFQTLYQNEYDLPYYLTMVEQTDAGLHQMCCMVRLANLARNAKIPLRDEPLPESLINFVQSIQPVSSQVIQLTGAWRDKKATIECVDGLSGYGFLKVDRGRYRVSVHPLGPGIKLIWLEHSSPCICGTCGRVMTQEWWFSHRDGNSLTVLGREFVAQPLIDWPSVIDIVEQSLLQAVAKQSMLAPNGLDLVWSSLQDSFRNRIMSERISPENWIKGTFSSWRRLFDLVNGVKPVSDWSSLWESIEQYKDALITLAI